MVSRSGTWLRSPSLIGPIPLGPLLQTLEAGPQCPGLLPFVLKDTLQGQALGSGLACRLSPGWAPTACPAFMLLLPLMLSLPNGRRLGIPAALPSTTLSQSPPLPTEVCPRQGWRPTAPNKKCP